MWDKVVAYLLASLIPASLLSAPVKKTVPPFSLDLAPLAITKKEEKPPEIHAKAGLILESHSNEILYQKNIWEPLPIASLTKLMTAIIVREKMDLDEVVTVSSTVKKVGGSRMGLVAGEKMSVRDLLRGLLIDSGNDAAFVLGEAVSGSTEQFVALMNKKKKTLGLAQSSFMDPAGMNDGNKASAFDLAQLAKFVFQDGFLQSVMREKEAVLRSTDGKYLHRVKNTNLLLGSSVSDRIIAGKTGTSPSAGQALVSLVADVPHQTTLMILLGSNDRFEEMQSLISWVDRTFTWE